MTKFVSFQHILLNQVQIPSRLLTSYKQLGLDERDVMVIVQIHRSLQEYIDFPTPNELATVLTMDEKECSTILRKLIQKKFITIEQSKNEQNILSESYSLEPLWEKLFTVEDKQKQDDQGEDGTIFILFEQEFGRPLSPFEIETINAWIDVDEVIPALIKAALRESVLMGKLNFKYIDRILRDWKRKGIHSVEQAREVSKSFHTNQTQTQVETKKRDTSFYYNWLEGED
ncbi:DnaD domain-containing protein [Virgibacillus byunsanensis]|uniref:DnaD domain-containing protein n=1 Tax=Virgibacillus byunsanensis TaxID=570945 RepID=A0ABW3LJZ8_9BACI